MGRDRDGGGGDPITKPKSKGRRRMCRDFSPQAVSTVKGLFVSRDRCPHHPQTKGVCSPCTRVGWILVAHSCCQHDPKTDG